MAPLTRNAVKRLVKEKSQLKMANDSSDLLLGLDYMLFIKDLMIEAEKLADISGSSEILATHLRKAKVLTLALLIITPVILLFTYDFLLYVARVSNLYYHLRCFIKGLLNLKVQEYKKEQEMYLKGQTESGEEVTIDGQIKFKTLSGKDEAYQHAIVYEVVSN